MKESELYKYYEESEPMMLDLIVHEKLYAEPKIKHRVTSRFLFQREVEIMSKVIEELNEQGIYVGYVYDALFCAKSDAPKVKEVMNRVILEHGVFTVASIG